MVPEWKQEKKCLSFRYFTFKRYPFRHFFFSSCNIVYLIYILLIIIIIIWYKTQLLRQTDTLFFLIYLYMSVINTKKKLFSFFVFLSVEIEYDFSLYLIRNFLLCFRLKFFIENMTHLLRMCRKHREKMNLRIILEDLVETFYLMKKVY